MNSQQAKEILILYRPGTADMQDPDFAAALQQCERDPELKQWFKDHCAVYTALRERLRKAPPAGLMQQIVSERKVHLTPAWRQPAVLAAVALLGLLAGILYVELKPGSGAFLSETPRQIDFTAYRSRMVGSALRLYAMDLATNNLDSIREYVGRRNGPKDYALPAGIVEKAQATGCAMNWWEGSPVAMICFRSGDPLPAGHANDLWLFVVDTTALPDAPSSATPTFEKVNRATTATWTANGATYLLVGEGNEDFIRRFL